MSTSAQQVLPLTTAVERRFYPRILPLTPIFVTVGENDSEESLLLNVSENGLLVSTPTGLKSNSAARLSLPLNGLPKPVQVTVRVLWASEEGNLAGIQLLNLSRHDRQQIRKWGTRESANSWQPERDHPSLVVPPSNASSETAPATSSFTDGTPVRTTRDIVPVPLARSFLIRLDGNLELHTKSRGSNAPRTIWLRLARLYGLCKTAAPFSTMEMRAFALGV